MCAKSTGVGDPASCTVNVFVTGQPGIGKTTLVLNVAKQLPQDAIAGFYKVEAKAEGSGERLGFDIVTFSGERVPLCRLRKGCGPKIGKYYVAIQEFERVVLPQLMPSQRTKLHIIDEVGRLELCSDKFREALFKLLDSQRAVFGALPAPRYGHTVEEVEQIKQRSDTAVLTLTRANRAMTAQEVTELLKRVIKDAQDAEDEDDDKEHDHQVVPPGQPENGSNSGHGGSNSANEERERSIGESHPVQQTLEAALAQAANAILGE